MRVISGTARGRTLLGPKTEKIRPVLDKVKGAIFNILGNLAGVAVLDLFAGTGAVGIEALSRGARHCTFVDASREAIELIRKNLEKCQFEAKAIVERRVAGVGRTSYRGPLRGLPPEPPRGQIGRSKSDPIWHQYDLIFVDPPYDQNLVNPTLRAIVREKLLAPDGTVVVEHSPRETIKGIEGLKPIDVRKYGQTFITFLKGT